MLSAVLTAIVLVAIVVIYKTYVFHTYWRRHGIKGPNLWRSLMSYTKVLIQNDWQWYEEYGNIIGFYEIFKRGLIINEPKLLKDILVKDFHLFTNRRYYNGGRIFDSGLFLGRDDQWKRVRAVVSQAFTPLKLRTMFGQISKVGDQFCQNVEQIREKGEFDIKLLVNAFVNDVICSCNFGIEIESLKNPNHPIVLNSRKFFEPDLGITNILGYVLPDIAKYLNFKVIDDTAVIFFRQVVSELIEQRKCEVNAGSKVNRSDLLQFLVEASLSENESGPEPRRNTKRLTADETFAASMDFFIAGYGTTVCTLSHICYYLAKHEDCQQVLFQELSQITELNEESLAECKYMNAVIKETLRLSPVSGRFDREAAKDYLLGDTGILVPKGCLITVCPFTVHHNSKYYPSPHEFKPEHFLNDRKEGEDYSYLSWGLGPRMCIGMNFALNEIRIFVYKLITKYRLRLASDFQLEYPKGNLINMPKEVRLCVSARL